MAIRVTLDTSTLNFDLEEKFSFEELRFDRVSVTDREVEATPLSVKLVPLGRVSEVFVLGESRPGEAVLAGEKTGARLEDILQIISN